MTPAQVGTTSLRQYAERSQTGQSSLHRSRERVPRTELQHLAEVSLRTVQPQQGCLKMPAVLRCEGGQEAGALRTSQAIQRPHWHGPPPGR